MPRVSERTAKIHLARQGFLPFVKLMFPRYQVNPVARLIAKELEWFEAEVEAGNMPRLIFEIPPRVGKSELVSRKYPGWLLGRHPDWYIGLVSYGADLAERLSRDARRVVMSDTYAEVFARYDIEAQWASEQVQIDPSSKSVSEWNIKPTKDVPQPGGMIAVGTRGTLTGKGFNVLLIDDPIKDQDEADSVAAKNRLWNFYVSTLHDRVEPGGGIIVIQQRWAPDDLIGRLLAAQDADVEDPEVDTDLIEQWRRVTVPAKALPGVDDPLGREPGQWLPGRRTDEQWRREEAFYLKKSPRVWAAKFQQMPVAVEGAFFKPYDWFRFEDEPDEDGPVYIFGDTSYGKKKTSDYSVLGVWRMETKPRVTFRLLEVYRRRVPFPELKRDLLALYKKYEMRGMKPRSVVIEDYGSGTSLIQEFMVGIDHPQYGLVRLPVRGWRPFRDQDKDARAHAVTDIMARGEVALPKKAPWLAEFLKEISEYQGEGTVEHDDQVDCLTMALILMGVQEPARKQRLIQIPFSMVG